MSNTSKTKSRRRRKRAASGRDRKRALAKNGTTPSFPINPEAAPAKAKPAAKAQPSTDADA